MEEAQTATPFENRSERRCRRRYGAIGGPTGGRLHSADMRVICSQVAAAMKLRELEEAKKKKKGGSAGEATKLPAAHLK